MFINYFFYKNCAILKIQKLQTFNFFQKFFEKGQNGQL